MANMGVFAIKKLKGGFSIAFLAISFFAFISNVNASTEVSLENIANALKETDTYLKYADSDYVLDVANCDYDIDNVIYTFDSSKTGITYTEDTLTISAYVNIQLIFNSCDYLTVCPSTLPYTYNYSTELTLDFTYSDGYLYWDYASSAIYKLYNADYTDIYEEEVLKYIIILFEGDWVKLVAKETIELRIDTEYDIETEITDTLKLSEDQWEIGVNHLYYDNTSGGWIDYVLYDLKVNYRYASLFCTFSFHNAIDYFKINLIQPSSDTDVDTDTSTEDNTQNTSDDYVDETTENPKTGNSDIYYIGGFIVIFVLLLLSLKLYSNKFRLN